MVEKKKNLFEINFKVWKLLKPNEKYEDTINYIKTKIKDEHEVRIIMCFKDSTIKSWCNEIPYTKEEALERLDYLVEARYCKC